MQPQPSKNIYNGQSKPVNRTQQARTNHTSGGSANRQQNFSNSTPRNRYVQTAAIFPPIHPGMVMSQFNAAAYTARPPNLQQCQYAAQFYPQVYYPYYVPQLPQQQQPSGNAGTVIGAMSMQPNCFASGPLATSGNHSALPFAVTVTNSMLNVANTTATQTVVLPPLQQTQAQAQLSYGLNAVPNYSQLSATNTTASVPTVSSSSTRMTFAAASLAGNNRMGLPPTMAGVPPTQPQVKGKLRSHALQIIHPVTNKNILQDLNNDKEISFPPTAASSQTQIFEKETIKISKSSEIILSKDYTKNLDVVQSNSVVAIKGNYKDATQQAEQITIATIRTQDACVEIVPNSEELLKSTLHEAAKETAVETQNLQENISRDSLKLSEDFKQKDNQISTSKEESCFIKNYAEIATESAISEDVNVKKEPKPVNDQTDIASHKTSKTSVERESVDEAYDDNKSYTDTSSVLEDQETFLPAQEVSENVNTCTESDETEAEIFNEESLINYNELGEIPSSRTDRKQYTRKQLMQLRQSKQSCMQPELKNCSIFAPINLMPAFAARAHKNGSLVVTSARGNVNGGYINYQNNYIKQNCRANRGSNNGAGSVVAGSSLGHHHQHNRNKGKPLIYLNLALNQDVQLNEAHQAWKPRVLATATDDTNANMPPEKEELLRRVRGILNKLTPEKFEPLVEEIIKLKIDTMDKMEAVMNLVFEKAIDEPNFSLSYAKLCHRLISEVKASDERMESSTKTNLAYFRNALLDKAEREFTHHVIKINAKEEKLKPLKEKYDNCVDSNEKIELEALLSEEERKIRQRSGGTVRFIGELFKMSILSGKIIHSCIEALLKDPYNEDMLECLCKLLTTVGQKFEQTCMSQDDKRKYSLRSVIQRMQNIASKTDNAKISSRVRFMLQDVIDLRKKKWQSTRNEAPKTMEQIEKEINNNNQTLTESLTNSLQEGKKIQNSEQSSKGKRIERSRGGYNEGNHTLKDIKRAELSSAHNANKWQENTGKQSSSLAVDTSKLVGLTKVDMNNKKMGGVSLFQWKRMSSQPATSATNSFAALSTTEANKSTKFQQPGRQSKNLHNKAAQERENCTRKEVVKINPNTRNTQRTERMQKSNNQNKYREEMEASTSINCSSPTPKAVFKEPNNNELKLIKSVVNEMLENASTSKFIDSDTVSCIQRLPATLRCPLIYYLLTDYLHLANVKSLCRRHLAHLVAYMIENQYLTLEHFHLAYRNFASIASDLIVDIPELWLYIFEFTGPLMVKNLLTVHDLWNSQLKESGAPSFSQKFLKSLLIYSTREIGPCFTRNMWQKHRMKWSDFMAQTEVDNFINSHQFEFVEDFNKPVNIMVNSKESPERLLKRVIQHIQQLLKENCHPDLIIDYINGNIIQMNRTFINNLSRTLTNFALKDDEIYSLDIWKFKNICLPILRRYLDSQEDLELECLDSINLLIQNLENPKGLWQTICAELNEADIIAQETFTAWQQSMAERNKCQ